MRKTDISERLYLEQLNQPLYGDSLHFLARRLLTLGTISSLALLAACTADHHQPADPTPNPAGSRESLASVTQQTATSSWTFRSASDCLKDSDSPRKLFEQDKCLYGAERAAEAASKARTVTPVLLAPRPANLNHEARRWSSSDYDQAAAALYLRPF